MRIVSDVGFFEDTVLTELKNNRGNIGNIVRKKMFIFDGKGAQTIK